MTRPRWLFRALPIAITLVLCSTLTGHAASPPLVPGESVGEDPDEQWWEGITIPTAGVLPEAESHPSMYADQAGVAVLRDRVDGRAPDPHGHYAMAWGRLLPDAERWANSEVDAHDDVKTKAAKATAFAWLVTREPAYRQAAVANLAAAFDDLVPTDQYVATQMTNYALAYDWVAADLTPQEDARVRAAVKRGADWLYEYLASPGVRSHNHRSKAGAALGSWALAFSADPDAQAYLDRGLENLNRVFRYMFTKDGIYRDGGGYYWVYTIINSTPFLWQYRNVSGVDLFPNLRPAFEWQLKTANPKGWTPPLDDGSYKVTWLHTVAAAYADTPTELSTSASLGQLFQWQFFASEWNPPRYPDDWTGARDQYYGWPEEIALYDSTLAEATPDANTATIDMNAGPRGGATVFRSDWRYGDPETRWGYFNGVAMSNNHDHADGLQLIIEAENAVLARDNGYGPQKFGARDAWKGPEHHNVVTADGAAVGDPTPTRGFLSGSGFGFAEKAAAYWNDPNAAHTRAVAFPGGDYFIVLDRMTADSAKTWDAYWHARGELSGSANRRTWTTRDGPWGDAAALHSLTLPADVVPITVADRFNPYGTGTYAGFPGYPDPATDVEDTTGLRLTQTGESAQLLSVLVPGGADEAAPALRDLGNAAVLAARVDTGAFVDTVVAPRSGSTAEAAGLAVEAGLGWVRTAGGKPSGWAMHNGTALSWEGRNLIASTAAVTAAVEAAGPRGHTVEIAATEATYELSLPASPGRALLDATFDGDRVNARVDGGRVTVTLSGGGVLKLSYGPATSLPSTPSGLSGAGYAGAVELTWAASPTATSYRVLRNGRKIAEVADPAYADRSVRDGCWYLYQVIAVNERGKSLPTWPILTRAGARVPAPPVGLVTAAQHAAVELSWLPVRDAATYDVLRAEGDGPLATVATKLTATDWTDRAVVNGTTYRYAVRAVNARGTGQASAATEVTPVALPPGVPTALTASRDDRGVTLRWEPGAYADSYRVLRGGLTDAALTVVASGVAEPTWTDTEAIEGTGYSYRVDAVNEAGVSAQSNQVTAVPGCTLTHQVGPSGAIVEAERYSASSGEYTLVDDLSRFGGRAAAVPRGPQHKNNPDLWGRYDLEVAEGGRYHLIVLGYGETGSNDSVTIAVDNGTPTSVNLGTGVWSYRQSPISIDLAPGFHTLLIKAREDGAHVDRFVLHPSSTIPDDVRFAPEASMPAHPECGSGTGAPSAPDPVTTVRATANGDSTTLVWAGSRLASGYTVLRDGVPIAVDVTTTTWTDTSRGSTYQVVSSNAAGDAPPSAPAQVED